MQHKVYSGSFIEALEHLTTNDAIIYACTGIEKDLVMVHEDLHIQNIGCCEIMMQIKLVVTLLLHAGDCV